MEFHYALRFESGERRGEVVPVTVRAGTFPIGRKPGNSLQVTDPSVSGRHAVLRVSEAGVEVHDLESTNGTHIGGRRVASAPLGHGDEFVLGAVEFTLLDTRLGAGGADEGDLVLEDLADEPPVAGRPAARVPASVGAAPDPGAQAAPLARTRVQPREDALEITAEDLARSRKSSKLGPLLVVALAAVGGGVWWWLQQQSADGRGRRVAASAPLAPPAGDLLGPAYSFEAADQWAVDESLAATFDPAASARRTGRRGVVAEVFGGEVALLESSSVRVSAGKRSLGALAYVRGDREARARLGLRFLARDGSVSTTVWSDAAVPGEDASEWVEVRVEGTAPVGMDEARLLVRAEGVGPAAPAEDDESDVAPATLEVDDVALVPSGGGTLAPTVIDEWTVTSVGTAAGGRAAKALAVTSLDRVLISSLRVAASDRPLDLADLELEPGDASVRARVAEAGELVLRVESDAVAAGVATMGAEGYAAHGTSFDRAAVEAVLVGADATLIRVAFDPPIDVAARPSGDDLVVRGRIAANAEIEVQVEFSAERTRAERLAGEARSQRRAGDPGAALRTWAKLLRQVPFDQRLVDEAATVQDELLAAGRDEMRALESEVERARFFGLADLYREKLARTREVGQRFEGSAVEEQAADLAAVIEVELGALDEDRDRYEGMRLEGIEAVLRDLGAEDLAGRLQQYRGAATNMNEGER